jgi:hypothetical protein
VIPAFEGFKGTLLFVPNGIVHFGAQNGSKTGEVHIDYRMHPIICAQCADHAPLHRKEN